jgi:hypothetical protein
MTIPRAEAGGSNPTASRFGGGRTGSRVGLPYLNMQNQAQYLSADVKAAKIIDVRVDTTARNPVTVKLAIEGKQVLWGLNTKNPNLDALTKAWGDQENDWVGKTLGMYLHEDEFTGQIWPAADPAYKPAGKKGA